MSDNFNDDISDLKLKIRQKCIIYRSNFKEFSQLIEAVKRTKEVNYNDIKQTEQLITQMNQGDVRIIFCGQVKSGKTRCVMEFLSGAIELPSKDTPATAFFSKIFYAENPVLYSEDSKMKKQFFEFDGNYVDENLVGKRKNFMVDSKSMDLIFNIGINNSFLKEGVVIIDSPGLNETQSLDDAFEVNLIKLNPQIVIYIFNSGIGFVDSDHVYYTTVIANLRKDLRKIFLFNKFDEIFKLQVTFPSDDESENESDETDNKSDDSYDETESDMEEPKLFDQEYNNAFERHKRKLEEIHCDIHCSCIIGYSGKFVQLHRNKKEKRLPQLRYKHLDLLEHVRCNINSLNIETTEKILSFTNQILFSEFKVIFEQILSSDSTSKRHNLLTGSNKEKLLEKFDNCHEKLINIVISHIPQVNFDGAICQIVKNQERVNSTGTQTKLSNIVHSLAKFFIDRYVNYFSNVILTKLEEISFEKLIDELRQKEIDSLFSHTFCALSFETEKIERVIKEYFDQEVIRIESQHLKVEEREFISFESYMKTKFKYQKELVWISVEKFVKSTINMERKCLEDSIEVTENKIFSDLKVSKEQTNETITNSICLIKKWLNFNNNYITELLTSNFTKETKKEILNKIVNESYTTIEKENKSSNILIKCENIKLENINYDHCEFIKYFLRSQYISSNICEVNLYYKEKENNLYFITDLKELNPLRSFLKDISKDSERSKVIKKLISIILTCNEKGLQIHNFCPDMVFCWKSLVTVEVKIGESILKFDEWKYTLSNNKVSKHSFYKYPYFTSEKEPSMFYGLCWTILIILYGKCEDICTSNINTANFEKEIENKFFKTEKNEIYFGCCKIIRICLQRPFKREKMTEIVKIFEDMIMTI